MKSWFVGIALAAAVGVSGGSTWASTVTLQALFDFGGNSVNDKFVGLNDGSLVVTNGLIANSRETAVGAFGWTVTSTSGEVPADYSTGSHVYTYCIQWSQFFYAPSAGNVYTLNTAVAGSPSGGNVDQGFIDVTAAAQLQALVTNHWHDGVTSAVGGAAFQLAVWEIEYDAGGANSKPSHPGEQLGGDPAVDYFGSGYIRASATTNSLGAAAISTATSWLNELAGVSALHPPISTAIVLMSPSSLNGGSGLQDQLGDPNPVPVPAALPLGIAMLVGMAAVRTIRRKG